MFMSDVQPAMNLTTANQSPMPPKPNREVRVRPLIAMRRRVVIESSRACRSGLRPKHLQLKQNTWHNAFNIYRCLSGPQWSKLSERFEAATPSPSRGETLPKCIVGAGETAAAAQHINLSLVRCLRRVGYVAWFLAQPLIVSKADVRTMQRANC